jgi:hypothetical protein
MQIDSKLKERPKSRIEVVALHLAVTESNTMAESEDCGDCLTAFQLNCAPGHRLCSMNGVHFVICITQAFPVKRLSLIQLANEYPFMTMPVSKMDNSRKCSLIYWWYMVNIYSVTGKGHHEPPPMCLVQ